MQQRILQPGEIETLDRVHFPRVRLPLPGTLFQERAARLRQLAEGNAIVDYLRFAARLVQAQHRLAVRASPAEPPPQEVVRQAGAHGVPLWVAPDTLPPAWADTLRALLADLTDDPTADRADPAVPASLRLLFERLAAADRTTLDTLARQALSDRAGGEDLVAAPLVMAALQVDFTVRAAAVDLRSVPHVQPATVCPVCASVPVASVLRIGGEAGGYRYLHCGLCATEWHMVRIKCSHCESTRGVRYQGIEGSDGKVASQVVLAETCDQCHTYRKVVNQQQDPYAEPLADDLASLTLDLLMGDTEFARASGNPLLAIERPAIGS